MARDYNFWIYIVTNRNHSVLYIGVTNGSLAEPGSTARELKPALLPITNARNLFAMSIILTFMLRSLANRN